MAPVFAPTNPFQPVGSVEQPIPQQTNLVFSGGTTADDANQNLFNDAIGMCAWLNAKLEIQFTAQVESYNYMMSSGVFKGVIPVPVAPLSWIVVPGASISAGPSYDQVGPPIKSRIPISTVNNANIRPLKETLVENTIDIGPQENNSAFYATGPGDTWPVNKRTPVQPDGHVYVKIPAPVGSTNITYPDGTVGVHGGWYEQVS